MQVSTLGKTGLTISRLGMGLAEIGEEESFDTLDKIAEVLNTALDGGINFLDTAACYFDSEEMLGRTISHRRDEYILATKCGHPTHGYPGEQWTAQTIKESVEHSLTRLRTDRVDLLQLHSPGVDVLERGEVIEALMDARKSGKTRFVGFSGDNEAARWAVDSGLFDTLQTSFSITDQHARERLFGAAKQKDMGIIIKRPIGSGAWLSMVSPSAHLKYNQTYGDEYFERAKAMASMGSISGAPEDRILASLGFVLAHPEVDTAIIGTRSPEHMRSNLRHEQQLPIPVEVVEELHRRFDGLGQEWMQLG